ncbi:hypothetical protein LINGRAHAP2_LOCUS21967 [Linum grandiflorum]
MEGSEKNKETAAARKRPFAEIGEHPDASNERSTKPIYPSAPPNASSPDATNVAAYPEPRLSCFRERLVRCFAGEDAATIDRNIARWMHECRVPLNTVNSPRFPDIIASMTRTGEGGNTGLSYNALRCSLLGDMKKECRLVIEKMRSYWKDAGCTIVADGWTDKRCRSFNFVVRSPAGTCFVKSVDSSGLTNDVDRLFKLFSEVIDWVGAENVVHVVTDNAANYAAVGRKIKTDYKTIYWTPCVAHTSDLILKDICALSHVSPVVQNASKVATFVYNHGPILYWLQRRETWKEIASPVATRFAATILTPRNVLEQQSDLEALAVSELFRDSAFSKTEAGKAGMYMKVCLGWRRRLRLRVITWRQITNVI